MTLDQHISHAATSDRSEAHARRVYRVQHALFLCRDTPTMTPAFAVELLKSIGLAEVTARNMVEGVRK